MTTKPVMPSQGACRLSLPWFSSSPSEGEPGGRPKPRKSSEVRAVTDAAEHEGQEGQRRHHRVGQQMAEHDGPVAHAERARGAHIFEVAGAQEFGAHHSRPARSSSNSSMMPSSHQKFGLTTLARMIRMIERRQRRPRSP